MGLFLENYREKMGYISALVTFYNPAKNHIDNVLNICNQVDRCFVCDNSRESNEKMFSSMPKNLIYIANYCNLGLSKAFNKVLKDSRYNFGDSEFIIFFDQDSRDW